MESALHFPVPTSRCGADATARPTPSAPCIGVFDSGVGGLSVLRALRAHWPDVPLLYVADSAHAPYGERPAEYVLERSHRIVASLLRQGAVGIVVACNTATAIAVRSLRAAWPELAIIGVEPGLKPAAALTRNGRVGVMATSGTLASDKFRTLSAAQEGITVVARACPGLARLIEEGDLDAAPLVEAIDSHAAALRAAQVDTVVLGCTHYAFVRHHIERAMGPDVQLVDTADAVARHATRRLSDRLEAVASPSALLLTSGDTERLRAISASWLSFPCAVGSLPEDTVSSPGQRP